MRETMNQTRHCTRYSWSRVRGVNHAPTGARDSIAADAGTRGREIVNSIQYGKLKIVDKLGELMPADSKRGRGKKSPKLALGLSAPTVSAYRKVHRNRARLDKYYEQAQEAGGGSYRGGLAVYLNIDSRSQASCRVPAEDTKEVGR